MLLILAGCTSGGGTTAVPPPTQTPAKKPAETVQPAQPTPPPRTPLIAWTAFDGGGERSGINSQETLLTQKNVSHLSRIWQQTLPDVVDSSPVELPNVSTSNGTKTLLFVTTKSGSLLAIDADTGKQVWRKDTQGPKITNSSPVIDPSGQFVYSYGLDGKVHKYAIGTGNESVGGGWPVTITLMNQDEKGASALNIANGYLYVPTSGYIGDAGHYEGHIVAVKLAAGTVTIFNTLCANIRHLLDNVSGDPNYCPNVQSGIWSRGGAVIDPTTGNVFVTTGNGLYDANRGGHNYGDSVIELSPDLTRLIDTYTPDNYATLQANDADLGSDAPVLLPTQKGSSTPYLAVQGGKDNTLRLLNRKNLSSQGGPGHVGGELQAIPLPQAEDVFTQPVAWNDANNTTWVFVATFSGFSAFRVKTDARGHTSLQFAYRNDNGGSSPFIASNIVFVQGANVIRAMNPATGTILWSSGDTGDLHWESPIVVNGHVYVPDNNGRLTAFGLK